ncbi:DNA-binding protein, partial [Achromatium sp. WMS3]
MPKREKNPKTVTEYTDDTVPILPLRDVVVYPNMVIPLFVGRDKSVLALDSAMQQNKQILLITQTSSEVDDPQFRDMYPVGTISNILQLLKLPDGTVKVLIEGKERTQVIRFIATDFFSARYQILQEHIQLDERETEVLMRSAINMFDQYVKLNKKVPPEVLVSLANIEEPGRLADTIAAHMVLKID